MASSIGKQMTLKIKSKGKQKKGYGLYMENVLTRKIFVPFKSVGSNIKEIIQKILVDDLENKCCAEGFVKQNSIRVLNYSSGEMQSNLVYFNVMFTCLICNPVEGMKMRCVVKNITKAGIRCESNEDVSPVDVFVSRDHNYMKKQFSDLSIGDEISVKVIGQRFELNDPKVSVLGELVKDVKKISSKPRLVLTSSSE